MKTVDLQELPYVAVTMGDGAGIGPEIVVAALLESQSKLECRPVVVGDALRLRQAAAILGIGANIVAVDLVSDAVFEPGRINVIDLALLPDDLPWGQLSPIAGDAAYHYIKTAAELAMAGQVQAICTAPLNKEALHAAGHMYPGHTELLAKLTGIDEVSMMLSTPKIRVIHVTTHLGLIDAVKKINPGLVERTIRRGHEALIRAGVPHPKIGVCAINPHAGEGGLFGQGRKPKKSSPAFGPPGNPASTSTDHCRRTPCSSWPGAATTTWSWRCTTIRAMARSRFSESKTALTSRWACL